MDKALLIKDFAKELRVMEDTVVNWEKRGRMPARGHMQKVMDLIPDVATFFESV